MEFGLCRIRKLVVFLRFRVFVFDKFEFSMIIQINESTNCHNIIPWLWAHHIVIFLIAYILLKIVTTQNASNFDVDEADFLKNSIFFIWLCLLFFLLHPCLLSLLTPCPFPIFFLVFPIRVQLDSRTSRVVSA